MIDTKAIRERADKATPGPWGYYERGCPEFGYDLGLPSGTRGAFEREADAAFIAHARYDVPALLDALAAAEARAEQEHARAERLAAMVGEYVAAWDKEDARSIGWDTCHNYPDVEDLREALQPGDLGEEGGK